MARPTYKPTNKERQQVRDWAYDGLADVLIAERIGIDRKTMKKHLQTELELGRADSMGEVMKALKRKVDAGNVGAIRLWLQLRREAAAMDGPAEESSR